MSEKAPTERQSAILEVIRTFTSEHGYPPSVREIGELVGLSSSSTIHAHLKTLERRGFISRDPSKPRAMRSGMRPDMLTPGPRMLAEHNAESLTLPIIGRVAAGTPMTAQENVEGEFVLGASFIPRANGAFMLRVQGDSMINAAILDGDLIVVHPQKVANNGEIVVAMLDGEATVKRYYKEAHRVRLQPENPNMEPIYATDVELVGRVEAVVRKL